MLTSSHCLTCILALAFLLTSIIIPFTAYGAFSTNKSTAIKHFVSLLDPKQRETYDTVVTQRRSIYVYGLILGIVLAAVIVLFIRSTSNVSAGVCGCVAVVVVFVTTFFYYILSPKSVYMVQVLTTPQQRNAWVNVYKTMQITTYGSFLGALVASFVFFTFLPNGVCK